MGVEPILSLLWPLLGASWLVIRRSNSIFRKALVQDDIKKSFWITCGRLLRGGDGFGEDFDVSFARSSPVDEVPTPSLTFPRGVPEKRGRGWNLTYGCTCICN